MSKALVKWVPPEASKLFELLSQSAKGGAKLPWWKRILQHEYKHPRVAAGVAGAVLGGGLGAGAAALSNDPFEGKKARRMRVAQGAVSGTALGGLAGVKLKKFLNALRNMKQQQYQAPISSAHVPMGPKAWSKFRAAGDAHFAGPAGKETIMGVNRPLVSFGRAEAREVPKAKAWEKMKAQAERLLDLPFQGHTSGAANKLFPELLAQLRAGAKAGVGSGSKLPKGEALVQRLRGMGYDTRKIMQVLHPDAHVGANLTSGRLRTLRDAFNAARKGGGAAGKKNPFFELGKELKETRDSLEAGKRRLF